MAEYFRSTGQEFEWVTLGTEIRTASIQSGMVPEDGLTIPGDSQELIDIATIFDITNRSLTATPGFPKLQIPLGRSGLAVARSPMFIHMGRIAGEPLLVFGRKQFGSREDYVTARDRVVFNINATMPHIPLIPNAERRVI